MPESDPHKQMLGALGRVASGLFILTARQGERESGMLVSWVQQCSFEPPQLSLALKGGRDLLAWLTPGAVFALSVLDDTQTDMVIHFGKGFPAGQPAFEGVEVERPDNSPPILSEALAYIVCRVATRQTVGDHELLIAQVIGGRVLEEGHPMVHVRKSGAHY
jgi:flavin reductase (DIM6/NTAB) family NADH-FMN oxidoreductase RutF